MSACWSAVYDAAPAAVSLLGALPLDVYRVIFAALDYATLRDACRVLNSVLAPVARQTLDAMRYAPIADGDNAPPIQCSLEQRAFFTQWCSHWCERCRLSACAACALRLGGFMLALRVCCTMPDHAALLLASFSARGRLERVWPLPAEPLRVVLADEATLQISCARCTVLYLYAYERHVYLLLQHDESNLCAMVRYARDTLFEAPRVLCFTHAVLHAVPRAGPARWTLLRVASCAVASIKPLRFALFCRGKGTSTLDQVVMLEMDADLNLCRALTLTTPTETNAAGGDYRAPWPSSGMFSGLRLCFHVDAHGRYVFVSMQVGEHVSLLVFEPQHGMLITRVSLHVLRCDARLQLLCAGEPQRRVCLYQSSPGCALPDCTLRLELSPGAAPQVRWIPYAHVSCLTVLLEDGYRLEEARQQGAMLMFSKVAMK